MRLPLVASATLTLTASGVRASSSQAFFPVGTPGVPWGTAERAEWLATRVTQRSYDEEVTRKIDGIRADEELMRHLEVKQYGSLSRDPERHKMYAVISKPWSAEKPSVLVTGGVHGYEKSGVQGALRFISTHAVAYSKAFNVVVAPCLSPWGYETVQRWNSDAIDPNRSFNPDGEVVPGRSFNPEAATEESSALIGFLGTLGVEQWLCHVDLHETTDTDETEFRPAKASRDGVPYEPDVIPDGFYLVSDSTNPQEGWHKAIIDAVRTVTHIAPPDADGKIIGEEVVQDGVIAIPSPRSIGLCAGVTNAKYATTTEVYPDSPSADEEQCNTAQVTAVAAALDYIIEAEGLAKAGAVDDREL